MKTLSVSEGESLLGLSLSDDGSGDFLVSIEVRTDQFAGHADGHVVGAHWLQFVADLRRLEQSRKGAARLVSASPGEFELTIGAVDATGHIGVSGVLSYRRPGVEYRPRQRLEFGFPIDPSSLVALAHSAAASRNGQGT
jgi:hypothetical protein